jgi:hypothetical protein
MRKPGGCCRVFLLLTPPLLLFAIGVVAFAIERLSSSVILAQAQDDRRNGGYDSSVYGLSSDFNQAPTRAILGICILVYIVSAIDVFGIWELRKVEGTARHQRTWAWIIVISSLIMAGASAGVMGYASSVQSNERRPQSAEEATDSNAEYTRETWACAMADFSPDRDWARTACGLAKATRLLLIPMAVSAALVLVSLWVLVRHRGGMGWLFGGKGRYAGFANVYELRPTSPGAQRVAQPQQQQQWMPYPVQQRPQQPVQPWPQQAYQQWPQQQYQAVPQQNVQNQEPVPKTGEQVVFR